MSELKIGYDAIWIGMALSFLLSVPILSFAGFVFAATTLILVFTKEF